MTTETAAPTLVGQAPGGSMTIEQGLAALAAKRGQPTTAPAKPDKPQEQPAPDARHGEHEPDSPHADPAAAQEGTSEEHEEQAEETPEAEDDQPEAAEGDDKVVLPDGTEMTVKELYEGYQRHSDYTRKTQALAEERRTLDSHREQVVQQARQIETFKASVAQREQEATQQIAQYQGVLQQLAQQLEQREDPYKGFDWMGLLDKDPVAYQRERLRYEEHTRQQQATRQALEAERRDAEQRLSHQREREQAERLQGLQSWARTRFPEWQDPKVAEAAHGAMAQTAKAAGYSDADLAQTLDPRGWELLHKAALYDQLQARKASVTSEVKPSPDGKLRVVKANAPSPRSTPDTARRAAMASKFAQAQRTGDLDDVVAAMQARRDYHAGR